MKLYDIVRAPWAITPEMYREVHAIYGRHARSEKIDLNALQADGGVKLNGPTRGYDLVGNTAVIPLDGVLAKRMNMMTAISGGTSMQEIASNFQDALSNPLVETIILQIDSPGGTVDGTQELSNLVYAARGQKPIIALADGTMASAAYWIGSAADQVFISSDTAQVGSIGVVSTHTDVSAAEAQAGIKTTEIAAGKYKRIASQYAPLSDEGRQTIQDQVDYTYGVFVDDVARNRGASVQRVLDNMADGRIFIGQQAIDAGLADGMATLDDLLGRSAAGEFDPENQQAAQAANLSTALGAAAREAQPPKETCMDVQTIKAQHPDVAAALVKEGADAERARIQAVEGQALPGHEALISTLKFDGKTSGPEAAVAVLAAEKKKKTARLGALAADARGANVPHAAAPAPGDEEDDDGDGADPESDDDEDASAEPGGPDSQPQRRGRKAKKAAIATMADAGRVAVLARRYQDEQAAKGVKVGAAEAVAHIENQLKKEARRG